MKLKHHHLRCQTLNDAERNISEIKNTDEGSFLRSQGIDVEFKFQGGASSGDFITIAIVAMSGVVGGLLGAIGEDLWKATKTYLKKRIQQKENDSGTNGGRWVVLGVFFVTQRADVPIVYFVMPSKGNFNYEFSLAQLQDAEDDIKLLIDSGKLNKEDFLGINLSCLAHGIPYLRFFKGMPTSGTILEEINPANAHAYAHGKVGMFFREMGENRRAKKHYELAMQACPDPHIHVALGLLSIEEGDFENTLKHMKAALSLDGRFDLFHFYLALFWSFNGDTERAVVELRKAVENGFSDAEQIRKGLKNILDHPETQKIIRELAQSKIHSTRKPE